MNPIFIIAIAFVFLFTISDVFAQNNTGNITDTEIITNNDEPFDIPNWVTLAAEIGVAILLAIIFFKLSRKITEEKEQKSKDKRNSGLRILGSFTYSLAYSLSSKSSEVSLSIASGGHGISDNSINDFMNSINPILDEMNRIMELYSNDLQAKELEYFQGLISEVKNLKNIRSLPILQQKIAGIDPIIKDIAELINFKPLKDKYPV